MTKRSGYSHWCLFFLKANPNISFAFGQLEPKTDPVMAGAVHSDGQSWCSVLWKGSYLVDPASSHMLVSKIKPCMSKYKLLIW
jgi:hypothetical protein